MSSGTFTATRVVALVEEGARPTPLLWPLSTAIAANPLWDLRDLPFADALEVVGSLFGSAGYPSPELFQAAFANGRITGADLAASRLQPAPAGERPLTEGVAALVRRLEPGTATVVERHDRVRGTDLAARTDREVAKWAAAYLGGVLPDSASAGFHSAWRSAAAADRTARALGLPGAAEESAAEAVAAALDQLGIDDDDDAVAEVAGQLARLPGWAAHAKWRSRWAAPDHPGPALELIDYLAVRLAYDAALLAAAPAAARAEPGQLRPDGSAGHAGLWLAAYERNYRDRLLSELGRPFERVARPAAQVVCCIDVRAEGLRRHLEEIGPYETFGFAGFFGVPARLLRLGSDEPLDLCPVLIRPTVEVAERSVGSSGERLAPLQDLTAAAASVRGARKGGASAYVLAEAGGLVLGPLAALRSAAPTAFARMRRHVVGRAAPPARVVLLLDGPAAPSDGEQALYAETSLRAMGLVHEFAPLVIFCGHGSTTENNPYASALDCGACGAARGGASARLAAAICNRPAVRALLGERGITVPADSLFVAAEHDTATDAVVVFEPEGGVPASHAELLDAVSADFARAGAALAAERAEYLPGAPRGGEARAHVEARSTDWAQVQPEWGLARCAAFVVAHRDLTAGADLERRAFLHSYDRDADVDGVVLETILSGPMVVAQWISAAYYFSTVDPDVYGAGDKVAHNVIANVAVYQGAGGDLKIGLPRQAVFDGDRPYHEPMRLLVVVDAPRDRIGAVVGRNPALAELTDGEWIHLVARDDGQFWSRRLAGEWEMWRPATAVVETPGEVLAHG